MTGSNGSSSPVGLPAEADEKNTVRRPWTPDDRWFDQTCGRWQTTLTAKRCCNGCQRVLGDADEADLTAAYEGRPLPDVREECGCG